MMDRTHSVTVDGVGTFVFRRRAMRDQIRIEADAVRILGGPIEDDGLRSWALAMATLAALTVSAPDGWDLDTIDPLDEGATAKVLMVYGRLRETEEKFRKGTGA
ncbi:hypothetical protein [Azospirillum sp.]|uniref:hypothetical protein n=1 Tax=Azospirillum sp. TaxID=34012 RepID=UPI003D760EC5